MLEEFLGQMVALFRQQDGFTHFGILTKRGADYHCGHFQISESDIKEIRKIETDVSINAARAAFIF